MSQKMWQSMPECKKMWCNTEKSQLVWYGLKKCGKSKKILKNPNIGENYQKNCYTNKSFCVLLGLAFF